MIIFGVASFIAGLTKSPWWYVVLIWIPHAYVLYSNRALVENVVGLPPALPGVAIATALLLNFICYGLGRGVVYAWHSMRTAER